MKSRFLLLFLLTLTPLLELQAQDLEEQTQQAFQRAASAAESSIVQIQTVGGVDLVGKLLTATGPTTGVVVREDGYIITSSFNFISKPASIIVSFPNKERFAASVVAQDESKMLTLLKIDASGLTPLQAAPKASISVGQWSLALGRTFDASFPNISAGIVSAKDRVWGRAIQTDAKTSPVNYGGPLIDLQGRGMGIIVPLSPDQQGVSAGVEWYDSGIGFAVYLEDLYASLDRLVEGETLKAGLLGVNFEDKGPLSGTPKILKVRPKSPADEASLQVDDVVLSANGVEVQRIPQLRHILGNLYAGDTIALTVKRGDETLEKSITLAGELLPYQFPSLGILPLREIDSTNVGIRQIIAEETSKVLQAGDRITQLNGQPVASRTELADQLFRLEPNSTATLKVLRAGKLETVEVPVAALPNSRPDHVDPVVTKSPETPPAAKTGRFNQQVPGEVQDADAKNFWVYVPDNYNPTATYSLLVWAHPKGDTRESDVLDAFREMCDERNIILVGPRAADISGWAPDEQEYVRAAAEWVVENYTIDPARIAVMGQEDSGVFVTQLAYKYRELIRGLILLDSPMRIAPPENDPKSRLFVCFVTTEGSPMAEMITKSIVAMQKRLFPTDSIEETEPADNFHPETVNELGIWIDALDRL